MFIKNNDLWYSEYHAEDSVKLSFKVDRVLFDKQSNFQRIQIYQNETFGKFMVLDGYVQLTERDEFIYHDMIVHPAMTLNPDIKRVLVIGAGDGGTARELSRYKNIEKIDMVEIDEMVISACKELLPSTAYVFSNEPRLNLMIKDGIDHVINSENNSYDLIIVDSTDPAGPGESLFTLDFYENCHRILSEDGILVNQHESAFYDDDALEMIKVHQKIKSIFEIAKVYGFNVPTYASGYWYFGFASKKLDPLGELNDCPIQTKYYNREIHKASFALPNYVKDILNKA